MVLQLLGAAGRAARDVDVEDRANAAEVLDYNGFTNVIILSLIYPLEFNSFRFIGWFFCHIFAILFPICCAVSHPFCVLSC